MAFKSKDSTWETENSIIDGKPIVFLLSKVTLIGGVSIPLNLITKICKTDGKLSAKINMSLVKMLMKDKMKDLPEEIVINISRNENKQVVFKSEAYPDQPAAAVTLK